MFDGYVAVRGGRRVFDQRRLERVSARDRVPGQRCMGSQVLFCGLDACLGPGECAGEHVVGRHTLQHLAAEKHLQALKGRLAARLERWRPSRQGDGRKEGFGSRFHFPGIRCAHAGQFAAVEGVVRAGGLVEELARAVLELAVSLHRLPVDLVGEREMPVGETLTDAGSMLL